LHSLTKKKKAKKKKEKKKRVIQFDGDPNEFLDIESLHIGIYLKPHDYVLVHLTLNWTCDALACRL